MTCLVTAGPTYEPLDQVRRLTNFSTGKLGTELAGHLAAQGHKVILLRGYYAVHQAPVTVAEIIQFSTTADLASRLQQLARSSIEAVFHAAAVSDFGFGKVFRRTNTGDLEHVESGKFSTRDGSLLVELVPTPKILQQLRDWFGRALLVGWKYEVDGGREEVLRAAAEQMRRCETDACVINGPAYGSGFGVLTRGASDPEHLADPLGLFEALNILLRR